MESGTYSVNQRPSEEFRKDGYYIYTTPIWLTVIRMAQAFIGLVILILAGVIIHGLPFNPVAFALVCVCLLFNLLPLILLWKLLPLLRENYVNQLTLQIGTLHIWRRCLRPHYRENSQLPRKLQLLGTHVPRPPYGYILAQLARRQRLSGRLLRCRHERDLLRRLLHRCCSFSFL